MRSQAGRLIRAAALFALWAVAKYASLVNQVWKPGVYSDTYYYFLQCQRAAQGGLALMTPEYPTPAAALLLVPWWLGGTDYDTYRWNFLVLVVAVDALFALLLVATIGAGGLLSWTLFETLAGQLALLRFDVIPAMLAACALLLLLRRRDGPAGALVAAGAAFKLWPALLFPLALADRRQRVRALAGGAIVGAVAVAASVAAAGWNRLFTPFAYQRDRGLQIEAVAATLPMLARLTDPRYVVQYTKWSAFEITGPTVPQCLALSTAASVAAVVALLVLLAHWFATGANREAAAYLALFAIAAFVMSSKALSPQYMLWIAAPAAVLLGHAARQTPPAPRGEALPAAVTAVVAAVLVALSSYVYPVHYDELLAGSAQPTVVLAARNAILIVFTGWCGVAAWVRRPEAAPRAPGRVIG